MKKLLLPTIVLLAIGAVVSWAQVLPQPGPPVPIACAYNTTPPTLTNGQAGWVQCTSGGKLDVNATVNASVGGFHQESVLSPITATTSGVSSPAFTAGKTVVATNIGTTNVAYCQLGTTGTTSSQPIAANGGWFAFTSTSETLIKCATSTSTTTVNFSVGTGLPTGTGGGSGGSGGAVTIADGADVTQGFISDTAWSGSGNSTVVAALKAIWTMLSNVNTNIQAAIPTGTNTIGGVFLRQSSGLQSLTISGTSAISQTAIPAQGGSNRFYMTDFSCSNSGSGVPIVFFLNGNAAGALPIWQSIIPAGGGTVKSLLTAISTTANTPLIISTTAASTTVYCNVTGYSGT